MARRGWEMKGDDGLLILLGMQDAALMAQNMVIAAESLGMGSCFLGGAPFRSTQIITKYQLPPRVFPMVQLTMGYPEEDYPPRPRYPMKFVLFEDRYPDFDEVLIQESIQQMDEGYLSQDYYRNLKAMIPLKGERQETYTYDNYSWTEHISRKWGQRLFPENIIDQLEKCGFRFCNDIKKDQNRE
jgi:nitroreductase